MAKILLMEDDAAFAEVLSEFLEHVGYDVITCATVAEAKAAFDNEPVDLVITDIYVAEGKSYAPEGGMTLITWLRVVRNAGVPGMSRKVPIIAISGKVDPDLNPFSLASAIGLGANCVFQKPPPADELLAAIAELTAPDDGLETPGAVAS